jgi:hypothetical protein
VAPYKPGILFGAVLLLGNSAAFGAGTNIGDSMTFGPSLQSNSASSSFSNPAMNSLMLSDQQTWQFSVVPSFGFGVEVGSVDNFADDLDDLIDIIDDPNSTTDSASEVLDRFNGVLGEIGESGYISQSSQFNAPLLPLFYQSDVLGGTIGVNLNLQNQINLSVLDAELFFDDQNGTFSTATSLYLKSGIETTLSVSYGRELFSNLSKGQLYAGVTANVIHAELSKQVMPLLQLDGAEVSDVIQDEYDNNINATTNVGLDVGVVWNADRYRLGLVVENINSPEFEYGAVGENCAERAENTLARSNCEAAAYFIQSEGEIAARETYTKHARARAEGWYSLSSSWSVSSSMDLAEYDDIIGQQNQWLHLALGYESSRLLLPSARIGYKANMTGAETSSVALGLNFIRHFGLDLEYGLDEVEVDGATYPRRLGFSISFAQNF